MRHRSKIEKFSFPHANKSPGNWLKTRTNAGNGLKNSIDAGNGLKVGVVQTHNTHDLKTAVGGAKLSHKEKNVEHFLHIKEEVASHPRTVYIWSNLIIAMTVQKLKVEVEYILKVK